MPALFMMLRKTILLPPETQSESVHYFMAMIKIIISSLPLKPKTSFLLSNKSFHSLQDTIMPMASLLVT